MLQNELNEESLEVLRNELAYKLDSDLKQYIVLNENIQKINFPVIRYPAKVKSINLDKVSHIEEKLVGIKGQYLIFDNDTVFNVRRHSGYLIEFTY
jgi:hypothetical protein